MPAPNQAETYLLACTSIVRDLIDAISNPDSQKEINLNALRKQYGKKYKMKGVPRLVDILSAVPEEWRDRLRGALRAKPVRTASGVSCAGLRMGLLAYYVGRWRLLRSCASRIAVRMLP
jgi:elongator complex protein 3